MPDMFRYASTLRINENNLSASMTNLQGFQGLLLISQNENTFFTYSSSASQNRVRAAACIKLIYCKYTLHLKLHLSPTAIRRRFLRLDENEFACVASYGCLINQLRSQWKHSTSSTALITIKNGRDICGNELLNTFPGVNIQNRTEDFEILTEKCESHKMFTPT